MLTSDARIAQLSVPPSCLRASLRPGGVPVGLASFSPLRERNLDDGRIAETENHDTNDKGTINGAYAKFIVQVIWLNEVDFILATNFLRSVPAGDNPRFDVRRPAYLRTTRSRVSEMPSLHTTLILKRASSVAASCR